MWAKYLDAFELLVVSMTDGVRAGKDLQDDGAGECLVHRTRLISKETLPRLVVLFQYAQLLSSLLINRVRPRGAVSHILSIERTSTSEVNLVCIRNHRILPFMRRPMIGVLSDASSANLRRAQMTTVSVYCAFFDADSDIADSAIQALLENLGTSSSCIVSAAGHRSVHHASLLPRLCHLARTVPIRLAIKSVYRSTLPTLARDVCP